MSQLSSRARVELAKAALSRIGLCLLYTSDAADE